MAATSSTTNSSPRLPPPTLNSADCDQQTPGPSSSNGNLTLPEPAIANPCGDDSQQPSHYSLHHALKDLHHTFPQGKLFPGMQHDTPYARSISSTAPTSPRLSKVSPDGRIANRDVGAKLVIIMVGLPARGKSYITNKLQRYLAWQQHHSKIFNVGNRRRVKVEPKQPGSKMTTTPIHTQVASILVNGNEMPIHEEPPELDLNDTVPDKGEAAKDVDDGSEEEPVTEGMKTEDESATDESNIIREVKTNGAANGTENTSEDKTGEMADQVPAAPAVDQSAKFFDPNNQKASRLREQFAIESLDELLDYLLLNGGSVGILDATNSTLRRRKALVERITRREPKLGVLFIESVCNDPSLLEANMRLKLSGPDYKGKDPARSLADFKQRVKAYESAYEPIGDYEEEHNFQYIKMVDVGRKIITHRLRGFLSDGIAAYLQTFNLSPRQIWITRHGQSYDNVEGRTGGDSDLTERGQQYSRVLYAFLKYKNQEWVVEQKNKIAAASFPPLPGDRTPPYPEAHYQDLDEKNFCVWTSMLKRTVDTAHWFDCDDDFDVKAWECLNEMHGGKFEGMKYRDVEEQFPEEYRKRQEDKLHYIYPGMGGEGYLSVIGRLREMIREIERITDHVCIISHRSLCSVLMAYFMGLTRSEITDLSIPLGMLYSIEPKPYGIEFHAYRYNEKLGWFDEDHNYKIRRTEKKT
ncbi:fructose-2,6-bisphosphatase [Zalerion maritima]|uniref:Fructose-2,6-bisphosphatase n=1 Tax=Zalerion maritima TaxID=339359 RepID=A0AAD5RIX4_9PEZI|nr:fructose-2,6-bisphosphatase [Zalerion maritima]